MAARADADKEFRESRASEAKLRQELAIKSEKGFAFKSAGKEMLQKENHHA